MNKHPLKPISMADQQTCLNNSISKQISIIKQTQQVQQQ